MCNSSGILTPEISELSESPCSFFSLQTSELKIITVSDILVHTSFSKFNVRSGKLSASTADLSYKMDER